MGEALRELVRDQLWVAEMPVVLGGFAIGARMTVVRLPDGGLWLHSPVALRGALKRELDALGPPRCLVAPSRFHYQHVVEFARAYPEARIYAAPGVMPKLRRLAVHAVLGDAPPPEWGGVCEQAAFRGSFLFDEV